MSDKLFRKKAPVVMRGLMREFHALKPDDAAAVLGNIGGESGGFTIMQEQKPTVAGSRGGYGWCQWTGPRRRAFEAWCAAQGMDISSDEANFGYLCHELRTTEKGALPAVIRANGLANKVMAFERGFERAGIPHYEGRIKWAQIALAMYEATQPAKPQPLMQEAELEPDPEPVRQPDDPGPEVGPAAAKLPWYKRARNWVIGAVTGSGIGLGGFSLEADTIYAICALVAVFAVVVGLGFLGWVYLIPPRGQIRKGIE